MQFYRKSGLLVFAIRGIGDDRLTLSMWLHNALFGALKPVDGEPEIALMRVSILSISR
jgi:hypothetical protein